MIDGLVEDTQCGLMNSPSRILTALSTERSVSIHGSLCSSVTTRPGRRRAWTCFLLGLAGGFWAFVDWRPARVSLLTKSAWPRTHIWIPTLLRSSFPQE